MDSIKEYYFSKKNREIAELRKAVAFFLAVSSVAHGILLLDPFHYG